MLGDHSHGEFITTIDFNSNLFAAADDDNDDNDNNAPRVDNNLYKFRNYKTVSRFTAVVNAYPVTAFPTTLPRNVCAL